MAGLAGCDQFATGMQPVATTDPAKPAQEPTEMAEPSAESRALTAYYEGLQASLLAQGLLRGDGGGPDTPFTDTILARNFVRIALFNEYVDDSDFQRPRSTISTLRRWDGPIRMSIEFGDLVPPDQRLRDLNAVTTFAARLSRLTGVPITFTDRDPNFRVLFLHEEERRAYAATLRDLIPSMSQATLSTFENLPRDQLCVVIGTFEAGRSNYNKAVAMIRAEHPSLMRTACIHEELAQGMGLANDSPAARPSIFNDDEEFALLTRHDELLLQMLYDPRLQTGMDAATAAPIARQIARDYLAAGAS